MESRDPKDLTPLLQEFWPKLRAKYMAKYPGRAMSLTCTHRPIEDQKATFAKNRPGMIFTRCDGVLKLSNHNYLPAKAFDLAVFIKGKPQWDETFYLDIGPMIKELGYEGRIRWGGWFSSFKGDVFHLEEM